MSLLGTLTSYRIISPRVSVAVEDDPVLVGCWLLEVWLTHVRWSGALLYLLLIPLFPAVSWPFTLLLVFGVAVGNAAIASQLRARPSHGCLRPIRQHATALEWMAVLGGLGLLWQDAVAIMTCVPLLLVLTTALRYGHTGLIGAAATTAFIVASVVGVQVQLLGSMDKTTGWEILIEWALVFVLTVLLSHALVQIGNAWCHWEEARWASQAPALHRLATGLTAREFMLLPWLAREDMTYEEIGDALHISSKTVKTHVQHISRKLDVTGRRRVVMRAKELALISSTRHPSD